MLKDAKKQCDYLIVVLQTDPTIDRPGSKNKPIQSLEERNIQTRVIFTGNILRQPGFKDIECRGKAGDFSNSDVVMKGGILLACHHGLTDNLVDHIHTSVELFLEDKIS